MKRLRSKVCEFFLKHNEVNSVSIIQGQEESHFSWSGCCCCDNGLGTDVYSCNGYSPKHKKIFELGEICGECIDYFYNGTESMVQS